MLLNLFDAFSLNALISSLEQSSNFFVPFSVSKNNLKVIDMAAANLCFERKIPVIIFGLNEENSIVRAVGGEKIGTIVTV